MSLFTPPFQIQSAGATAETNSSSPPPITALSPEATVSVSLTLGPALGKHLPACSCAPSLLSASNRRPFAVIASEEVGYSL